jgi:HK97 gp10 family phage protein
MITGFDIQGLNETYKMLDELNNFEKKQVIVGVLRNAANKHIKLNLQAASPFKKQEKSRKNPFVTVADPNDKLGVISGVSRDFFYYRFTEFGTKERFTRHYKKLRKKVNGKVYKATVKKKVVSRGIMPKNEFAVKVIEKNIQNVVNYFINDFGTQVAKRLKALARKKAKSS